MLFQKWTSAWILPTNVGKILNVTTLMVVTRVFAWMVIPGMDSPAQVEKFLFVLLSAINEAILIHLL